MKTGCALFVLLLTGHALAVETKTAGDLKATCEAHESNGSRPGFVIYPVLDPLCQSGGGDCHVTFAKDRDRCIDAKTLLKQTCKDGKPASKRVSCHCVSGMCARQR